jgi:hypothetical protein
MAIASFASHLSILVIQLPSRRGPEAVVEALPVAAEDVVAVEALLVVAVAGEQAGPAAVAEVDPVAAQEAQVEVRVVRVVARRVAEVVRVALAAGEEFRAAVGLEAATPTRPTTIL